MLDQIIPFRYLDPQQRERLQPDLEEHTFASGDVIVAQSDDSDDRIYLLVEGTVEAVQVGPAGEKRVGTITAGHYFGERAVLFDESREVDIRALGRVRALSMPGIRLLELLRESEAFAQALGDILRHKQGIFVAFDRFLAELLRGVESGSIHMARLLELYRTLEPALHRHANDDELDFSALGYAVRRLPENVTRTFAYYLTETLPPHYEDPDRLFAFVPTAARRHAIYELLPGKNMVLIRDGRSDILDLLSCLCVLLIEGRKIRKRLQSADVVTAIADPEFDGELPFSEAEQAGLRAVWPVDTTRRLREVVLHHEDVRIEVHRQLNNYNSAHAERWSTQVAAATEELLGVDPADLPPDRDVHIISSNTHSVPNCLSAWLNAHAGEILDWGRRSGHELVGETWQHELDAVYAMARDYFRAHPDAATAKQDADIASGMVRMRETAFTGIQVQLIDGARLSGETLDGGIAAPDRSRSSLIVNIDYAFGQQAEHIIVNLLTLFGRNLRSVNVLGKAGGLEGARGDILAATGFVEQTTGAFQPLPGTGTPDTRRLAERAAGRGIHVGNVLTVAGTLLQNRKMLLFNKHVWGCVGLEMEGTHYLRKIEESMHRGVVSPELDLRFLYYVSDLPLDHDSNLSGRMRAVEGIPPLYAVTREILSEIFAG